MSRNDRKLIFFLLTSCCLSGVQDVDKINWSKKKDEKETNDVKTSFPSKLFFFVRRSMFFARKSFFFSLL